MSAADIVNELGIQCEPDLIVELDEQFAAADEIAALEERGHKSATKLGLIADTSKIYAAFGPGPTGSGPCDKKGTGAFSRQSTFDLKGTYKVEVARLTVKVYDSHGKVVWKGNGVQKGLTGTWEITF